VLNLYEVLFWSSKQKVFLGPFTKGGESISLWAKDGAAAGGGWAVVAILNFKLRNLAVGSCSSARFFVSLC